jgi:hypothetical protein
MPNTLGGSVLVRFFLDAGGAGCLCALVFRSGVLFPVARLFCLIELKTGVPRGRHAHPPQKFLTCPVGAARIVLIGAGAQSGLRLEIHVIPMTWLVLEPLTQGTTCLVLALGQQSEAEHIRDPKEFEEAVGVTLTKWEREV